MSGTFERVSNDKYLKVFDNYITNSKLRQNNFDKLYNNLNLLLINENYVLKVEYLLMKQVVKTVININMFYLL